MQYVHASVKLKNVMKSERDFWTVHLVFQCVLFILCTMHALDIVKMT